MRLCKGVMTPSSDVRRGPTRVRRSFSRALRALSVLSFTAATAAAAVGMSAAFSSSAQAGEFVEFINSKTGILWRTYGEFGIGGYMASNGPNAGLYDNGVYIEGGVEFKKGPWYALIYAEGNPVQSKDGESYVPSHGYGGFEGGSNRLYVGYSFDNHTNVEIGMFNDSSLDDLQFWTDFTPEFGYASPNTRDVAFPLKIENTAGTFKWSVTASPKPNYNEDDDFLNFGKHDRYSDKYDYPTALVNGYVMYAPQDGYGIMAGTEITDGTGQYYTIGALVGDFAARVWHHTGRGNKTNLDQLGTETGFMVSAKAEPFRKFWLSISYTLYDRHFDEMQGSADGKFGFYDETRTAFVNGGFWWEHGEGEMVTAFDAKHYTGNCRNVTTENQFYLMQIFYW